MSKKEIMQASNHVGDLLKKAIPDYRFVVVIIDPTDSTVAVGTDLANDQTVFHVLKEATYACEIHIETGQKYVNLNADNAPI
jgi:hypothetical protein